MKSISTKNTFKSNVKSHLSVVSMNHQKLAEYVKIISNLSSLSVCSFRLFFAKRTYQMAKTAPTHAFKRYTHPPHTPPPVPTPTKMSMHYLDMYMYMSVLLILSLPLIKLAMSRSSHCRTYYFQ